MGWKEKAAAAMLEARQQAARPAPADYSGMKDGQEPLFPLAGQMEWPLPAHPAEREPAVSEEILAAAGKALRELTELVNEIAWNPETYAPLAAGAPCSIEAEPDAMEEMPDGRLVPGWPEYRAQPGGW